MDNVVQNININNIIPSRFPPNQEELQKMDELVQFIKNFGLLDPILVRPRDEKYEIVMGIDKYEAAKISGMENIPVIIKEIDDKTFYQYVKMTNHSLITEKKEKIKKDPKINNNINNNSTIPLEEQIQNDNLKLPKWLSNDTKENSDIVNLSELNKVEIEYERDDQKMNNEQLNNVINNTNIGAEQNQMPQVPTFGGKFFPSLEDEPTNMNIMNETPVQPVVPEIPTMNNQVSNSNLIDLTDLSIDKEPTIPQVNEFINPSQQTSIEPTIPNVVTPNQDFGINQQEITPIVEPTDNIISLENLQVNNPVVQPPIEQTQIIPTINTTLEQSQIEIPQNIQTPIQPIAEAAPPVVEPTEIIPTITPPIEQPQVEMSQNIIPDFGNSTLQQPQVEIPKPNVVPSPEVTPTVNQNVEQIVPTVQQEQVQKTLKDVVPITNTIRNLVTSLEKFGYKINISEEDLPTSTKIIIEVEK